MIKINAESIFDTFVPFTRPKIPMKINTNAIKYNWNDARKDNGPKSLKNNKPHKIAKIPNRNLIPEIWAITLHKLNALNISAQPSTIKDTPTKIEIAPRLNIG